MKIVSCKDAKSLSLKLYYTGTPCRNGNLAPRRVNNSSCTCDTCVREILDKSNISRKQKYKTRLTVGKTRAKGTINTFDDRHRSSVLKICEEKNYTFIGLVQEYTTTLKTFLKLKCNAHDHMWETTSMASFFSGVGCKKCATDNVIKSRTNPNASEYKKYLSKVHSITRKQDISSLLNFDKPRTLCGIEGGHQLDHIISIKTGFENNIAPEIIGNINNLQIIPWKQNRDKWYHTNNKLILTQVGEWLNTNNN